MSKSGGRQRKRQQKKQGASSEVGGESGHVKKEEPEDFKVEGVGERVSCRRELAACEQKKGY